MNIFASLFRWIEQVHAVAGSLHFWPKWSLQFSFEVVFDDQTQTFSQTSYTSSRHFVLLSIFSGVFSRNNFKVNGIDSL